MTPRHPHIEVLHRMKQEVEAIEREIAERERRAAGGALRDVARWDAEYAREWNSEYITTGLEAFLSSYRARPVFEELWRLALQCADARFCYRALAHARLSRSSEALAAIKRAVRTGSNLERVLKALWDGRIEDAVRLAGREEA
jgi:hypothetical protein